MYNATKSRGYCSKVADEGAVLVLADVVGSLADTESPEGVQAMRRAAVSICRLTRTNPSAACVLREQGVRALADAVAATVALASAAGPDRLDMRCSRIGARLIRASTVCRMASAAVCRLLFRPDSCVPAAEQGACRAAANLTTSHDPYVQDTLHRRDRRMLGRQRCCRCGWALADS